MAIHTTPDSYTKLLIHSDTSDGSTTFVDSSSSGHTLTQSGASHQDSGKKFGATSILFDGGDDYVKAGDHADWDFGTGDFTIDFWMYPTDATAGDTIMNNITGGSGSNTGWVVYFVSGPKVGFYNMLTGSALGYVESPTLAINTWSHVALVRNGDVHSIYLNGVAGTAVTYTGARDGTTSNTGLYIGADDPLAGYTDYQGYLDEIRISKGIARWTDSFVPPNKPYSVVDDDFVTDVAGIEDVGDGRTTFGQDIIIKSNPDEASTDSVFSVSAKDGTVLMNVRADGILTKPQLFYGNVAPKKSSEFSTNFSSVSPALLVDGEITVNAGLYKAYFGSMPATIGFVWEGAIPVIQGARFHSTNTSGRPRYFQVDYSTDDGSTWNQAPATGWLGSAVAYNTDEGEAANSDSWNGITFSPVQASRWRFHFHTANYNNGNNNCGMDEIEFIGYIL